MYVGSDQDAIPAILENTGWVAGWVPNKKSQLGYVREMVKHTVVANWLISNGPENGVIEPFLCTTENFHDIILQEPKWPLKKHTPKKRKLDELTNGEDTSML